LVKNQNFCKKTKLFAKKHYFRKKNIFFLKKSIFSIKVQKSKFWSEIIIAKKEEVEIYRNSIINRRALIATFQIA